MVLALEKLQHLYWEQEFSEGEVECAVLSPLRLRIAWLLGDERPPVHEVLKGLQE